MYLRNSVKLLYSVLPAHLIPILVLPGAFSKPHLQEQKLLNTLQYFGVWFGCFFVVVWFGLGWGFFEVVAVKSLSV